jgi:hypothetical protein
MGTFIIFLFLVSLGTQSVGPRPWRSGIKKLEETIQKAAGDLKGQQRHWKN